MGADDVLEAVVRSQFVLQPAIFTAQAAMFDGLLDETANDVQVAALEGLFEIPEGTRAERLDGVFRASMTRDDDVGEVRVQLANLGDELDPAHSRKPQVAEDEIELLAGHPHQRFVGVGGALHRVAGPEQEPLQCSSVQLLVVYDQDSTGGQRNLRIGGGRPRSLGSW